ncbi:MAG TPA: OsmC family protein [Bacteroidales bacterium]|nr:OsmC family protein [Bacteroidales bacterium]
MTTQSIDVSWAENMAFKANINGHELMLDLDESAGGNNLGPKPKPLLLVALGGCTAMDVISILKKMRIEPTYFNVKVDGEVTEEHPKHFTKIKLIYEFRGKDLPLEKLQKAIDLSHERYCGVSETLRKSVEITSEIRLLDISE